MLADSIGLRYLAQSVLFYLTMQEFSQWDHLHPFLMPAVALLRGGALEQAKVKFLKLGKGLSCTALYLAGV